MTVTLPPYFIKFGKEKYVNDLHKKGIIYFNPIEYFKKVEEDEVRGDSLEGAVKIHQITGLKVLVKDRVIATQVPGSNANLIFHDHNENGNIFSLYSVYNDQALPEFRFDSRLLKFGDTLLIIKNTKEFTERILNQFQIRRYKYNLGYVRYYDKYKYSGALNVFDKPDIFKYQYEFRFFVENSISKPLILEIGSIKKIALIFDMSKIHQIYFRYQ